MPYYFQISQIRDSDNSLYIHREKWPSPWAAIFFNASIKFKQSWQRVTQETFVPLFFDKKLLKSSLYGKCPKISNTLKLPTPKLIAENNF